MRIFGKPSIDKLKSKGDVKALHRELVSPRSSLDEKVLGDAAVALLDLDATDLLREALLHELSTLSIGYVSKGLRANGNWKACRLFSAGRRMGLGG